MPDYKKLLKYSDKPKSTSKLFAILFTMLCLCYGLLLFFQEKPPEFSVRYFENYFKNDTIVRGLVTVRYSNNLIFSLIFRKDDTTWTFEEDIFLKLKNDTLFRISRNRSFPDSTVPPYLLDNKDTVLIPFAALNGQNFEGIPSPPFSWELTESERDKYRFSKYNSYSYGLIGGSILSRHEKKHNVKRNFYIFDIDMGHIIQTGKCIVKFNKLKKEYSISLLSVNRLNLILLDSMFNITEIQSKGFNESSSFNIMLSKKYEIFNVKNPITIEIIRSYLLE